MWRSERTAGESAIQRQWCLGPLDVAERARRGALLEWPTDADYAAGELPDDWIAAIDEVFEDCDLPAARVMTDCSEPPCVAVLRATADRDQLIEALDACPPLLRTVRPEHRAGPVLGALPGRQRGGEPEGTVPTSSATAPS